MCGRFVQYSRPLAYAVKFDARIDNGVGDVAPKFNAAPQNKLLVVDNARRLTTMNWGLSWRGNINARCETVGERQTFAESYRERRCIIPTEGFYEWKHGTPYFIHIKDGRPFGLAGIFDRERRFAILTTDSNSVVEPIHDRMPVVLQRREYGDWLAGKRVYLGPPVEAGWEAYQVSRRINNPDNEGIELIRQVA